MRRWLPGCVLVVALLVVTPVSTQPPGPGDDLYGDLRPATTPEPEAQFPIPSAWTTCPVATGFRLNSLPQFPDTITFSFYKTGSSRYEAEGQVSQWGYSGPVELHDDTKAMIRQVIIGLGATVKTDWLERDDSMTSWGQMRFVGYTTGGTARAFAQKPDIYASMTGGADIALRAIYDYPNSQNPHFGWRLAPAGSHPYHVVLHEIGHALGLKHPDESSAAPPYYCTLHDNGDPATFGMAGTFFQNGAPPPYCAYFGTPHKENSFYSVMSLRFRYFCPGQSPIARTQFGPLDKYWLDQLYRYGDGQ